MRIFFVRLTTAIFLFPPLLLMLCVSMFWVNSAMAVELTMYCSPIEAPNLLSIINKWEEKTGHTVKVLAGPATSSDVLSLYHQQLSSGRSDIDIYEIDVVWTGLLSNYFIDLKPYSKGAEKIHISSIIENNTVNGRLIAMPLYVDVGMIFYRKDLLHKYAQPVPKTWQELAASAKIIVEAERAAGNTKLWGLVFQGRAYEGLTCSALEWINSFGGGTIVDSQGIVTVNNPNALLALKEVASWIDTIVPKAVLNYSEEDVRGFFQSGNSVFMRNWPYAYELAEAEYSPIKGKVGIMPVPKGSATVNVEGNTAGTLGGWGVAISKHSKNKEAAADLIFYLSSKKGQHQLSLLGSYIPSVVELLSAPKGKKKNPMAILELFNTALQRPTNVTGFKYTRVSSAFYNAVHSVLSNKSSAEDALGKLEFSLQKLGADGWH